MTHRYSVLQDTHSWHRNCSDRLSLGNDDRVGTEAEGLGSVLNVGALGAVAARPPETAAPPAKARVSHSSKAIFDFRIMPRNVELIEAYRKLYRHGLRAVQYASPARHVLKQQLNQAFRNGAIDDFDKQKVENTLTFLRHAAEQKGLEHRILKSFLHMRWWDMQLRKQRQEWVPLRGYYLAVLLLGMC